MPDRQGIRPPRHFETRLDGSGPARGMEPPLALPVPEPHVQWNGASVKASNMTLPWSPGKHGKRRVNLILINPVTRHFWSPQSVSAIIGPVAFPERRAFF